MLTITVDCDTEESEYTEAFRVLGLLYLMCEIKPYNF